MKNSIFFKNRNKTKTTIANFILAQVGRKAVDILIGPTKKTKKQRKTTIWASLKRFLSATENRGVPGATKSWLKEQVDEETLFYFVKVVDVIIMIIERLSEQKNHNKMKRM